MQFVDINKIRRQFVAGEWPQFLESIEIHNLRGWTGQVVNFGFPVTAVVGENGTGKSTVLKAAAAAYEQPGKSKTYYPSAFFPTTPWDTVEGVKLIYTVRAGSTRRTFRISKAAKRWSFPDNRIKRNVFFFDISRTLPLDASAGYAKIAKQAAQEVSTEDLSPEFTRFFSYVLGRDYARARFASSNVDKSKFVGVVQREFGEVSQFHQGAGEDATLDLFRVLQRLPDYSLLIIDEVEASLHPRAQRRLIRFLLWLSQKKRIQVILSTHSPYVLEELPQEARVLLMPGPQGINVVYGVTPEFALSRIDDSNHPELVVYVEDNESATLLREILFSHREGTNLANRIAIRPVGPADVVRVMGKLGREGRLHYASIAFVDGDMTPEPHCHKLPGNGCPEEVVFQGLRDRGWPNLVDRFGIGAGSLYGYLEDAMRDPEPHNWTRLVGDRVLRSADSVWEVLAKEWAATVLEDEERNRVVSAICEALGVNYGQH